MIARAILIVSLLFSVVGSAHARTSLQNLRQWRAPDHTRVVFDLSGPAEYRMTVLPDPDRVVIDLEDSQLHGKLPALDSSGPLLAVVRAAQFDARTLRVVIDLKSAARPRVFVLPPAGPYGHRLVVDLFEPTASIETTYADVSAQAPLVAPAAPEPAAPVAPRLITIAIDAGHGGEDPGAIGRRYRTREKDVTLAIARELAKIVTREPGMRAVLTRKGDYYIGLRQRYSVARAQQADVFVSIHADAVPARSVRGASVYALSERGATDAMAKMIADKENASDLIGGVSLNDKDDMLAKVLLDLSQTKTMHDSLLLGGDVLAHLQRVGPVHFTRVRQAGFTVLKAPDIPSVLVETAYISNPTQEKQLRSRAFQRRLAEGIFKGVQRFLARNRDSPEAPALITARVHVVQPGETIAAIARKYDVTVSTLRLANDLANGEPLAGLRLQLP